MTDIKKLEKIKEILEKNREMHGVRDVTGNIFDSIIEIIEFQA